VNNIIPKKSFYSPVVSSAFGKTSAILSDMTKLSESSSSKKVPTIKRPRDDDDFLVQSPQMNRKQEAAFTTPKRTRTKLVAYDSQKSQENQENEENVGNSSSSKPLKRWNSTSNSLTLSNSAGKG
jgi:hypothetical protein